MVVALYTFAIDPATSSCCTAGKILWVVAPWVDAPGTTPLIPSCVASQITIQRHTNSMGCPGSKDEVPKAPEPATTQPERTTGATEAAVQPVSRPPGRTRGPVERPSSACDERLSHLVCACAQVAAPTVTQAAVDKPTANESTVAKIPVDKATYVAWEAEVIKAFYTPEHKVTALLPTDELPAVLSKQKYILVS